jgi:hypothetical protein
MKFISKTVVIEAEQYLEGKPIPLGVKFTTRAEAHVARLPTGSPYVITIHGAFTQVVDGDWIIQERDGIHYYPCKPDVFEQRYELLPVS